MLYPLDSRKEGRKGEEDDEVQKVQTGRGGFTLSVQGRDGIFLGGVQKSK